VPPVKGKPDGPVEQNPRLMALNNFKEISRIMTKNYLANKKLEARFGKASGTMPKNERDKKRVEDEAQQRMVDMLKKMHMSTTFMSPATFKDTSVDNFNADKRGMEMSMQMSGISKHRQGHQQYA
jgi:hypothetical protein